MANLSSIYRGRVMNNADPQASGRVQVAVPSVLGGGNIWAETCMPFAGNPRPAGIGELVWVMFEGGDADRPVVIGRVGTGRP